MKELRVLAYTIIFAGTAGWALGQSQPAPASSNSAPLHHASFQPRGGSLQNSNMHLFNNKVRAVMRQIQKDKKSGKLTQDQAKAQLEKLKLARKRELQFFKKNDQKEITADQKTELEKMLN